MITALCIIGWIVLSTLISKAIFVWYYNNEPGHDYDNAIKSMFMGLFWPITVVVIILLYVIDFILGIFIDLITEPWFKRKDKNV